MTTASRILQKKADHSTIDYKSEDTWFVVSGDSDTHYYTKGVKRGDNVIVMELEYEDDACNDIADATLTEISRNLTGIDSPSPITSAADRRARF